MSTRIVGGAPVLLSLGAALLCAGPSWAFPIGSQLPKNYYLDAVAGDDGNSGQMATDAWQTITRLNQQTLNPGDKVFFKGGQTFPGKVEVYDPEAGTAAKPIRFTSFGGGKATISAGNGTGIDIYNSSGIEVINLRITGSGYASGAWVNQGDGINAYVYLPNDTRLPYLHFDNLEISGFRKSGIAVGGWNGYAACGYTDVTITDSNIHDNGRNGIFLWGWYSATVAKTQNDYSVQGVYIAGNTLNHNFGDPQFGGHSGSGLEMAQTWNALVEYNLATNNGYRNTYGFWCWDANHVTMQHNISANNVDTVEIDGGGFDLDGGSQNCTLQYNYSYNNFGPGYLLAQYTIDNGNTSPFTINNTIRYNVSENDARRSNTNEPVPGNGAITVWDGDSFKPIADAFLYGNTVYLTAASDPNSTGLPSAIKIYGAGTFTNLHLWNNIFSAASGVRLVVARNDAPVNFQGNLYYEYPPASGGYLFKQNELFHSLDEWRTAKGEEKLNGNNTGMQVDPLLTAPGQGGAITDPDQLPALLGAYRIGAGSPARNGGLWLPQFLIDPGVQDFYGGLIPAGGAFDIGAHEYQ